MATREYAVRLLISLTIVSIAATVGGPVVAIFSGIWAAGFMDVI